MLTKILKAGVAGSLLLASAAYAAENSTATSEKAAAATSDKANASATMTEATLKGDWRTSKVVGLNVYNDQNENVGSINDLLMDKSGNIKTAVLSVGGFLGMGAHYVAVPFDKIKFSDQPVSYSSASNSSGSSSTAPGGGGTARPASSTTTGSANNSAPATASKPNPWYPDHAVFDATKDQLKNMPEFKYSTE